MKTKKKGHSVPHATLQGQAIRPYDPLPTSPILQSENGGGD